MKTIHNVLLVVNMHKQDAQLLSNEIQQYLTSRSIHVELIELRGKTAIPEIGDIDLVISLGGDGTVLYCARMLLDMGIPIVEVNLGTFGFIT